MIRRRPDHAEAFASAWEQHASGRRSSVRQSDVDDLVRAAELLCASATVQPRADFRSELRERLMAEAADVLVAQPTTVVDRTPVAPRTHGRARRRLAGLAAAAVASVGAVGLVSSSASAVPGDALYSVKRGVENIELSLRRGPESQGTYQLERATERLSEAKALASDGASADDPQVADVLDDFSEQADSGSADLLDAYSSDGSDAAVETLGSFTTQAAADLVDLSNAFEGSPTDPMRRATDTVRELAGQVGSICKTCTDVTELMRSVSASAPRPSTTGSGSGSTSQKAGSSSGTKDASKSGGDSAPSAQNPPSLLPAVPDPTSSPTAPSIGKAVKGVTDPLLGGLLGDETQPGLVPGLLDGLLGNGQ